MPLVPGAIQVYRGIVVDCTPAAQSTPAATIAVKSGVQVFDNVEGTFAGNAAYDILTGHPADPTLPRWDRVWLDSTSALNTTVGTPVAPDDSGAVAKPALPSTANPIADVYVAAAVTTITAGAVQDVRNVVGFPRPTQSFTYSFLSGAQAAADPGAGNFGFDTASVGTLAHMYASSQSAGGIFPGGGGSPMFIWLSGGTTVPQMLPYYLLISSQTDPTLWMVCVVTAVVNHSTWVDVSLTVLNSNQGSPPITNPRLNTTFQDCVFQLLGPVPTITSPTATNGSGVLSGDVTMTLANTFYDGPTTPALGAGTFLLEAYGTFTGVTATTPRFTFRLTDGTTTYAEAEMATSATVPGNVAAQAIVPGGATYKITAASTVAGCTMKRDPVDNSSGAHLASKIDYVKIA